MSITQGNLFADAEPPMPDGGPYASVAIERSLDRVLDYAVPRGLVGSVRVGQRVRVPLGRGNKPAMGYVVAIRPTAQTTARIKALIAIDDERVLVPPNLMELAQWMARYYCCPLGTVLDSVIPSAVKKKIGLEYTPVVRLVQPRDQVQAILEKTRAPKRRAVLARLLQLPEGDGEDLARLAGEAGATAATIRMLVPLGLISITPEPDYNAPLLPPAVNGADVAPELNQEQQKVFEELRPRVLAGGFSVNLLHGVTGSGKTEIYLRCIQEVIARGKRAIVLVPEIALTPQTERRFLARFGRVAVLHSGLVASARHRFWQQIAQGRADVVVGARSAVFAPVPDLGMIVVDEEHESSYKQDSAPRYQGRDVAVKRAQIEAVPILLGSATPSLEMYSRVTSTKAGPYHLLSLPHRVRGLQLPHIELLDMKQEMRMRRPGVHLLSQRLEHLLRTTVDAGHQVILLLNRRGYANFVYCPSCSHLVKCKYCDVTMTYHRSAGAEAAGATHHHAIHTGQLHCHYCLAVNALPEKCPECGKRLSLFGLGTQRVQEELAKKFPAMKFARVDSDTMHSSRDYEAVLGQFARGEIHCMLGTQMIAKGLDYPNVTLVGVISGDTALALPDFRAAERTFQLITQVAGRAGRGDAPGRVLVQTFQPESPTIQAAIKQDFVAFAAGELSLRRAVALPPFSRMVRIVLRDESLQDAQQKAEKLAAKLAAAIAQDASLGEAVAMKGPMPCAIGRIAGHHRQQIVLQSLDPTKLHRVLDVLRAMGELSTSDKIAVDVDPVSLL